MFENERAWKCFHSLMFGNNKGWKGFQAPMFGNGRGWNGFQALMFGNISPWKHFHTLMFPNITSPTPISYLLTRRVGAERCTFTFFGLDALVSFTFSSLDSSAFSLRDFLDDLVSAASCAVSGFR